MLEEVLIVALIAVDGLFVKFKNDGTNAVEEVTVVRHHQQSDIRTREVVLEPLNHLQIEMVRRLVEDEEVGLHDERVGEGDALHLSARKLRQRLVELRDEELREDGLSAILVVPSLQLLHTVEDALQSFLTRRSHAGLILADEVGRLIAVPEASLNNSQVERIVGRLLQVTDAKVVMEDNLPLVGLVFASQDVEQRAFARAVLGDKTHFLPLTNTKAEVAEKRLVSHTSRQILCL